jgi:uncharacterized membrane protein YdbT with pleckstrin-like domain
MPDEEGAQAVAGEESGRYDGGVHIGRETAHLQRVRERQAADDADSEDEDGDGGEDEVPVQVARYLLPYEKCLLATRRHPVLLAGPAAAFVLGLLAAIAANGYVYVQGYHPWSAAVVRLIWLAWAGGAAWAAGKWLTWRATWFVVTPARLIYITGLLRRAVTPLPVKRARDVELHQSVAGRQLGYGTLAFESIGTEHALHAVTFVPYPDQVFALVWTRVLSPAAQVTGSEDEL